MQNTQGGDLLIGIDEKAGVPVSLIGVECLDTDKEKLRLLEIFRNRIEPRITNIDIEFIEIEESKYIILIRTQRSWLRPHRGSHNSKFYARQSNGKYELNVQQLRHMFLGSTEFNTKYADFHAERAAYHIEKYGYKPFILLHFIPVSAFENLNVVDLTEIFNQVRSTPIGTSNDNKRINFTGVYSESEDKSCKFQLFRNGIIEHATIRIIEEKKTSGKRLYDTLRKTFAYSLQNYRSLEIMEPVYALLSFYGVEGLTAMDIDTYFTEHDVVPYESDKMIFPEVLIEDVEHVNLPELLRPIMDAFWNAYGFSRYSHELN
ncbi:ATP-binding protein [Paenibacillus amylolyticus]|nr:ATP-binding protein [Paenibacillus amylolyticus]